jgi:hypothetical protein
MDRSLSDKLGVKDGFTLYQNFKGDYVKLIGAENIDLKLVRYPGLQSADMIHLFCSDFYDAETGILEFKDKIKKDGMIWVSWPKKNSNMNTGLNENQVRQVAIEYGLVDIKVCSVNHTWSALKFVIRKKNR